MESGDCQPCSMLQVAIGHCAHPELAYEPARAFTKTVAKYVFQSQYFCFLERGRTTPTSKDLACECEHVLGGGICDFRFASLTTSLQKQLDNKRVCKTPVL
jgi:hypothetical protein